MPAELFVEMVAAMGRGEPFWLVTVTGTSGSAPAAPGMKMIVYADGRASGTVGGGKIEHLVRERLLRDLPQAVEHWRFDLGGPAAGEPTGMICGGGQEVLVEYFGARQPLFIFGGGHCGMALSALAARCGFSVTVVDDRPEWAARDRHPAALRIFCTPYDRLLEVVTPSEKAYAVVMTAGHAHDETVLRLLLTGKWRYIGMLGSQKKVREVFARMEAAGVDKEKLWGVFAPVGFAVGSHTPDEIAVSIAAQLIAVRNGVERVRFNENPLWNF